ncbi:unnamed protein product [Phytophthora fragariaefolia]|uniref:Unnamed protein product n=1 Tax=Phytophthora fragariaefolia TaxID=1490495 RepID=A0A9W6TK43_9STRA|nr:unnamed protein product [Phytophthora fragariaefolia]
MQALYIRGKLSPSVTASAAIVTLLAYVQYQEARMKAISNNRKFPPRPDIDRHVNSLYSGISTGMKAFGGSNDERDEARANLFAMQLAYGQPSLFFNVSPDSSLTFRIANLAGELPSELLDVFENKTNPCAEFARSRLGMIATQHPMQCAK